MQLIKYQEKAPLPLPLFLTEVPAGFPSPAEGYMDDALDLNELLISHPAATFFVRVSGHSMTGAHIYPGDVVIVDRAIEPKDRSIVLAVVNGEFTIKRLSYQKGKIFLLSENKRFAPIEIQQEEDFQVWGVITYVIHKT